MIKKVYKLIEEYERKMLCADVERNDKTHSEAHRDRLLTRYLLYRDFIADLKFIVE